MLLSKWWRPRRRDLGCEHRRHYQRKSFQLHRPGLGRADGEVYGRDTFVYEYLGEVVEEKEMNRRMQQYKDEGIRHFYFMMLQREEVSRDDLAFLHNSLAELVLAVRQYIDATKRGGLGRFINHSCNPNCQVAKWTVGKYMRMGIFTKRDVEEGEELSFNYNVDRYGNEAQPCYCGEPNCIGVLGGKTQTDIGGMDQLFIEALGISDEVDRLEARGSRRKKSRHLDEDYNPTLRPIEDDEVGKVVTAMRQATSLRHILQKLLSRVHMTQDVEVQRRLVRLHGFVLMAALIDEWIDDREIVLLALGSLARWPLIARNKVVDSGVDQLVTKLAENGEDEELSNLAKDLLSAWEALEMQYRIARKDDQQHQQHQEGQNNGHQSSSWLEPRRYGDDEGDESNSGAAAVTLETAKAPNWISGKLQSVVPRPLFAASDSPSTPQTPDGHSRHLHHNYPPHQHSHSHPHHHSSSNKVHWQTSLTKASPALSVAAVAPAKKKVDIEEIIRQANESQAEQRRLAEQKAREAAEEEAERRKKEKAISISAVTSRKSSSNPKSSSNGNGHHHKSGSSSSSSGKRQHSQTRPRSSEGVEGPQKKKKASDQDTSSSSSTVEKRLRKLMGEIVVKVMSRYSAELDRDVFKKHARELTNLVCEKELRARAASSSASVLDDETLFKEGLPNEKKYKVKVFADDYAKKLVQRKGRHASASGSFSMQADDSVAAAQAHSSTSSPSSASLAATASTTATTASTSATSKESNGMRVVEMASSDMDLASSGATEQ
ncbi:hypothetical protein L7F22_064860 [Adiantum nelumboides]|nr:hypothetical protein [Adiantum nelumboides]